MAFNAYPFLLLFLPVVLALLALARLWADRAGQPRLRQWLILGAGVSFYALGSLASLPYLLVSALVNYWLACRIVSQHGVRRRIWMRAGVGANVASLVFIKYTGFLAEIILPAAMLPTTLHLFMPLGLSFFTFQQISFLIDVERETVAPPRPLTYLTSITFFPSVISGPIAYPRELFPQIASQPAPDAGREDWQVGSGQFAVGLFKKTVIADSFAMWVDPMFAAVHSGLAPSLAQSWMMVAGYLFYMYFDFSGYSDMALGCARMLRVRLPLNFYSPLRVTSIMDWWRRWHMSLGRFVNDYVFQSLALPLTRMAMGRRYGRFGVMVWGVLIPTGVAMFVIGAWHGGRWTYIVFGGLHAFYMVVAESWRFLMGRRMKGIAPRARAVLGHGLTLVCVLVALAPFRADNMADTLRIWAGMADLGAEGAPAIAWPVSPATFWLAFIEILGAMLFVYLLPNTAQVFVDRQPSLPSPVYQTAPAPFLRLRWRANWRWGLFIGFIFALGAICVSRGGGQFVYFAF